MSINNDNTFLTGDIEKPKLLFVIKSNAANQPPQKVPVSGAKRRFLGSAAFVLCTPSMGMN